MQAQHNGRESFKRSKSHNAQQMLGGPPSQQFNQFNDNNQHSQFTLHPSSNQLKNEIQPKQSDEFSSILGALNHDVLDDYQLELFKLLRNANDQSIISFFQNHSQILYKFLITLYIVSLDKWNPFRSGKHAEIHKEFQTAFKQQKSPSHTNNDNNNNHHQNVYKQTHKETHSMPAQPPMAFGPSVVQPPMAFTTSNNDMPLLLENSQSERLSKQHPSRPNNVLSVKSNDNNLRKSSFAKGMKKIRKIKKSLPNLNVNSRDQKEKTLFVDSAEIIAPMTRVCGKIRITTKTIAFIPDREQPDSEHNLALNPPDLERVTDSYSFLTANEHFRSSKGEDDKYWIAVNVASSYEQIGGSRYKLMNAKNVWQMDSVTELYYRRYQGRKCAFELYVNDDSSWLFNVKNEKNRDLCFNSIIDAAPNLIDDASTFKNPKKAIKSSKIHHKWCSRQISNFEYIMRINLLSGRSFQDLEQYPIVPWILIDYESEEIDLKNPKIYRDLRKPVGALNDARLQKILERYECMDDASDKFMYGTHYSTKAIVLYYLIRMEPFTSYNRLFQGGKFDQADRLFMSIQKTFRGCMRSTSDVKELIPEFYYMSDFLENKHNLDLGVTVNGDKKVDNVWLPPWAKGSYTNFVKIMRNAFESEYVSRNLHHWIDLIFGYKQKGVEAEKAYNVFHPYTYATKICNHLWTHFYVVFRYQDHVDFDTLNDDEKEVTRQIISEFGQTPTQIFKKAHRVRLKGTEITQNIFKAKSIKYYGSFPCTSTNESSTHIIQGIAFMAIRGTKIITVTTDNRVEVHKFDSKAFTISRKTHKFNKSQLMLSKFNYSNKADAQKMIDSKNKIHKQTSKKIFLKNLCFCVTMCGTYLFAAGFKDHSFVQYNINNHEIEHEYFNHNDLVCCLALDENERKHKVIVVSASYDKSLIVWKGKQHRKRHNRSISGTMHKNQEKDGLRLSLVYTKTKHDSAINCVDISVEKGIMIAASKGGVVYMYHSSKGDLLWTAKINSNIAICRVSKILGTVCLYVDNYDDENAALYLYGYDGQLINSHTVKSNDKYHEISFSKDGNNICCGGLKQQITIYNLPSFQVGRVLKDSNAVIKHVLTDKDERYILCALANGNVLLYSFPRSAQKATPKLPHRGSLYGVVGNAKKRSSPFQMKPALKPSLSSRLQLR